MFLFFLCLVIFFHVNVLFVFSFLGLLVLGIEQLRRFF